VPNATPAIRSIDRRSLHEELVERLRDYLLECALDSGDKVPERELCESFGVSRTPMREALKVLAADGIVTLIPNRGAVISTLTPREFEELFSVIGALEALAGELACARISDRELQRISRLHDEMLCHYQERHLADYFRCNEAIHQAIFVAAANSVLTAQYQSLSGRLRRARYAANLSESRWAQAIEEHGAILEALKARQGEALASILKRHLDKKHYAIGQSGDSENHEGGK
jgi:DNA-binding GntR family transcriptional regulator